MTNDIKQPLVGIILLNYNGSKDTLECIGSLREIEYSNYHVIVVDNKSTDDSQGIINKYIDENYHEGQGQGCTFLQAGSNRGFAAGNNVGIRYAMDIGCEYVLLLNNDTLVEKDFLDYLVNVAVQDHGIGEMCQSVECNSTTERGNTAFKGKGNKVGIVTGKICYEGKRDTLWFAGGEFVENRFYGAHRGEGEVDRGQYDNECFITFATGCLMLISKEALESVGVLSEEYFMYYEDVDYCLKIMENGFSIKYCPKALIYHRVSSSTGGEASPFAIEWNTRNRLRLINKYGKKYFKGSKIKELKLKLFFYSTRIIVLLKYIFTGKFNRVAALWKGLSKKGN
ncbi:hypothetical protein SAMN02745248_02139 [Hathewaya proteolytica DSM 3090]|uniref:Glycosyltransferase 2-like domain-containing protein n=1 Tax=Hathewaya proteolytica DSM 3090 TaxID=1121331 RepID=A0A1M6QX64_9CLOT|nr:glycosyltransferase family 2 protein [Hathewaya proteolytica]SHK24688.1 hypothetical protein SAMN02745248_02139 [Hathewaya proteolytica DSM 3090]